MPLRLSPLTLLALLSLWALADDAQALIVITAHGGSSLTLFKKGAGQKTLSGTGYTYGGSLMRQPGNGRTLSVLALGISGRQILSSYTENNIKKNGAYTIVGPEMGLTTSFSESMSFQSFVLYSPSSTLTTISSQSIRVNNEAFHYSTWENYRGNGAIEGRLTLVHDKVSGQFSKQNRFRSGLGISYSTQTLSKLDTKISTSREALTPSKSSSSDEVNYNFSTMTLDLFLGFSF